MLALTYLVGSLDLSTTSARHKRDEARLALLLAGLRFLCLLCLLGVAEKRVAFLRFAHILDMRSPMSLRSLASRCDRLEVAGTHAFHLLCVLIGVNFSGSPCQPFDINRDMVSCLYKPFHVAIKVNFPGDNSTIYALYHRPVIVPRLR